MPDLARLRDDLRAFSQASGQPSNVRNRVLAPAVERANAKLRAHGAEPLPEGLTPHSLRRTFASLLCALGESPAYAMAQLGHTSAALTFEVYAKPMRRGETEKLTKLVGRELLPALPSVGRLQHRRSVVADSAPNAA
jgi:integrase